MKKFLLIGLLIGVMIVSACTGDGGAPATDTYIGGNMGVEMRFSPSAPPDRVADAGGQETFDIVLELENKGENLVLLEDAFISIKGFPPEAFGVSAGDLVNIHPEEDLIPRIKTADGTIIEPPIIYATVSDLQYQYTEPGNVQYPIRAEICYLYETNVATKLCLKRNLNKDDDNDLCAVNSPRSVSSSGAPIQVSRIQQSAAGRDKTRFTFTIENRASGDVFKELNGCEEINAYEDKVFVEIENLLNRGADSVNCVGLSGGGSDNGYVTLTNGISRDVSCTVTMIDRSDRLQPFNIRLSYDYREIVDTSIIVEYTPIY